MKKGFSFPKAFPGKSLVRDYFFFAEAALAIESALATESALAFTLAASSALFFPPQATNATAKAETIISANNFFIVYRL